jgi:hypothetical protein
MPYSVTNWSMSPTSNIVLVITGCIIFLRVYKVFRTARVRTPPLLFFNSSLFCVEVVKNLPIHFCGFPPLSVWGATTPTFWWNLGLNFTWHWKDCEYLKTVVWPARANLAAVYKKRGSEVVLIMPLVSGPPTLYTSSPEVVQQVLGYDSTFKKPDVALALKYALSAA